MEFRQLKQQERKAPKPSPSSFTPTDTRYLENLMREPFLCEEARRFLFDERKISPQVVRQVGLSSNSRPAPMSGNPNGSWFNAPSLLIPYRDIDGRLLSVQARYLGKVEREGEGKGSGEGNPSPSPLNLPRFQFPRGSRCGIFNLPILKTLSEGSELWITEGVTDCLAMMSSGRKAIAIPSATLLKPKDLEVLLSSSSSACPEPSLPRACRGEGLSLNITINRYRHKTACTEQGRSETLDGKLYIDGQKICDTAENANGALPEGEYEVSLLKCKQYKRKMLVLSPVEGLCLEGTTAKRSVTGGEALGLRLEAATLSNPVRSAGVTKQESEFWLEASTRCDRCPKLEFVCNNTTMPVYCPMLKPGNGVHNRLDGSIILGIRIIPGCLKHPKQAFDAVYGRIRKSIERGNQVTVTIKNEETVA